MKLRLVTSDSEQLVDEDGNRVGAEPVLMARLRARIARRPGRWRRRMHTRRGQKREETIAPPMPAAA